MHTKHFRYLIYLTILLIALMIMSLLAYIYLLFVPQKIAVSHYFLQIEKDKDNSTYENISKANTESEKLGKNYFRIIQLSDLHSAVFGDNNERLIESVKNQSPDIILMTGDMINRDDSDLTFIKNLISKLSKIAPVYFGYGNHETAWESKYGYILHKELSSAGATVLDDEYIDVDINDVPLRIGGFRGYYGFTHMDGQDEDQKIVDQRFFDNYILTDRYRILLNHIPTQWLDWNHIDDWHTGLVFSGHYHGGQIVIPFIGGLFAPYVGWFPEYTKGCYVGKTSTCILSSGLGNERSWLPRVNNAPEIVVADINFDK